MSEATESTPDEPYRAEYAIGFATDREFIEPSDGEWDAIFVAVERFVCRNPYLASWEYHGSDGTRFLVTRDAGFLDAPSLVFYFKPDEERRTVRFLTVQQFPEVPDEPDWTM